MIIYDCFEGDRLDIARTQPEICKAMGVAA